MALWDIEKMKLVVHDMSREGLWLRLTSLSLDKFWIGGGSICSWCSTCFKCSSFTSSPFSVCISRVAYKALDKLFDSSQVWDFTSCRDKSAHAPKKGGIYKLKGETEMNRKIDALTKRLDAVSTGPSINAAHTYTVDSCSICVSPMHSAQNCPSVPVYSEFPTEQVNAFNDYQK